MVTFEARSVRKHVPLQRLDLPPDIAVAKPKGFKLLSGSDDTIEYRFSTHL